MAAQRLASLVVERTLATAPVREPAAHSTCAVLPVEARECARCGVASLSAKQKSLQ
jgi:hypothetical protein